MVARAAGRAQQTARPRRRHSFDPAVLFGVAFSRIIFSYSLSMIPAWRAVLGEALRWLAPDGELHIVDFAARSRCALFRAGLRRWLAQFHVTRATSWRRVD